MDVNNSKKYFVELCLKCQNTQKKALAKQKFVY